MKYGFVIDNRKCIGCHACTTACKSEHEVPVGVFRTWVKQVEKGTFPHTRRLFSVLRCNHCTNAPCVEICPVEALYYRPDGIVDFDKDRCIGCKSCMQACPYDALYIDPDTHTAAKCNYCAHRVDVGLEPACVVVCPEHAIVSGDMDDPQSEISETLARHQTTVRKPEKGTTPNVYYIDGDFYSLTPTAAAQPEAQLWSEQTRGVGHFAQYTERLAWQGEDLVHELLEKSGNTVQVSAGAGFTPQKSIEVLTGKNAKRVYDAPDKGLLWGWEVPAYVTTKAIAAGAFLLPMLALTVLQGSEFVWLINLWVGVIISLVFLAATTVLLVKDLDQPKRFLYVLLRPQWKSWLTRGAYVLVAFGGLLILSGVTLLRSGVEFWGALLPWVAYTTVLAAVITAVYTAFLFAQARGRDFWQSPLLPLHMLVHAFMAGGAVFTLVFCLASKVLFAGMNVDGIAACARFPQLVLVCGIVVNLAILLAELTITHPTSDAKATVALIRKGRYRKEFYTLAVFAGNILPLAGLLFWGANPVIAAIAAVLAVFGIYRTEKIWIEAPQRMPLS